MEINGVSKPQGKFSLLALPVAINISVAFCQLTTCTFWSLGQMSNISDILHDKKKISIKFFLSIIFFPSKTSHKMLRELMCLLSCI